MSTKVQIPIRIADNRPVLLISSFRGPFLSNALVFRALRIAALRQPGSLFPATPARDRTPIILTAVEVS
jgi:hypothetical protein